MALRTYELHPAVVHAPLALLPTAAVMDLLACSSPRRRRLDRTGLALWWATAGSALVAGLSGMAASQEIEPRTDRARDVMFLHGIGNLILVLSAAGVALRSTVPMTASRTDPWPTNVPKFGEIFVAATFCRKSLIGSGELPSGPS